MEQNYPLIRLRREKRDQQRIKNGRPPRFPKKISYQIQTEKLGATFDDIARAAEAWGKGVDVANDPRAVIPDRALVFELIGPVEKFETAAAALGFEWLAGERVAKGSPDEEEDEFDGDDGDSGGGVLYLTMPSQKGLKTLLERWRAFIKGASPSSSAEDKTLWALFGYLKDVRPWSAKDRVNSIVTRYVEDILSREPEKPVIVEIDLWFRASSDQRLAATVALGKLLLEEEAELLDSVTIEEIQYQAALIRVPARIARDIAQLHGRLANADEVMTIRAQSVSTTNPEQVESSMTVPSAPVAPLGPCIAAIIDGYPVSGHKALADRLVVLETDVTAIDAQVAARYHGTAMASLILHGDLQIPASPLNRKLAAVPVLISTGARETTPANRLPVGVVHRAIQALRNGTGDGEIKPSEIVIVNHSICDDYSPFSGRPSPWAALLDYYAHAYNMLFVVSAGNVLDGFSVEDFENAEDMEEATDAERLGAILLAIEKAKSGRGILSPAESVNALTVGALHADGAADIPEHLFDPYPNHEMTNLCSAVGPGVNRSIKPDVVEYGGRMVASLYNTVEGLSIRGHSTAHVGQGVAAPDPNMGRNDDTCLVSGTSNAAALVTRTGIQIADAVEQLYRIDGENWLSRRSRAVIVKALITHGCKWDAMANLLHEVFPPEGRYKWSKRRDTIASFLGYGRPDAARVTSGEENRITLLADDEISHDQLHEYRIPIPTAILTSRDVRRIIITLAWSTPISISSSAYRGVTMSLVDASGKTEFWKRVGRIVQPNHFTSERGTLIHLVLEGNTRTSFSDPKGLFIGVQARSLGKKFEREKIPYALAVTVELASSQKTSLYADVKTAIQARIQPRVQQRT